MSRADYHSRNIRLLPCIVLLWAVSGCAYQAKLLDPQHIEPGAAVVVRCNVIKKPVIKVSEAGDFVFWAGGPGPLTWYIAHVINKSTNDQYRKMLKPALETDYFCENFNENLKEAVEQIGLQVEQISIERKKNGIPVCLNVRNFDIFAFLKKNDDHKYILRLKILCGLFKSEAQSIAQIEGRLIRADDKKLIWKNKLSFEGRAAAEHKPFGDGKEAVRIWEKDCVMLQNSLYEVLDGVIDLLAREFAGTAAGQEQQLTKLKLNDGSKIKGTIIDTSDQRLVVRLEGGSLRSMPAEKLVSTKP